MPKRWKRANITAIFKKNDPTIPPNYRPISLLDTLSKVLERCVYNHCYEHLHSMFHYLQHGFLRGRSTNTQLLVVYHQILECIASGQEVDAIYLDFSKAFDKVQHNLLLLKLKSYGISDPTLSWFGSYLSERQQRVVINGHSSDWLPVTSGVPQGSILGPLLFLIYINDLPTYLENNSSIALYADDSKLFRPIYLPNDSFSLQKDLDSLSHWGENWAMAFNVSKCKVVHFSRKKLPSVHHLMSKNYYLSGNQLENVPNISDLGITITNNLSWSKHIEEIVSKANRTLGLVKRLCRDIKDTNTRKLLYCTVVRPKLEYCSSLWSPYTGKHRLLIENVQRRATRFILNYPKDMSYPLRLQKLRLLPLEFRREISDLTLLFKSRNGLITMDVNKYLNTYVYCYRTRNYDPNNYNLIIKHKQDYFRKSFFTRVAELWNTLPSNLKTCNSITLFKTKITNLYSDKLATYCLPS